MGSWCCENGPQVRDRGYFHSACIHGSSWDQQERKYRKRSVPGTKPWRIPIVRRSRKRDWERLFSQGKGKPRETLVIRELTDHGVRQTSVQILLLTYILVVWSYPSFLMSQCTRQSDKTPRLWRRRQPCWEREFFFFAMNSLHQWNYKSAKKFKSYFRNSCFIRIEGKQSLAAWYTKQGI